jgi:hypothetical protein
MIPLIHNIQNRKIERGRKMSGCQGLGGAGMVSKLGHDETMGSI